MLRNKMYVYGDERLEVPSHLHFGKDLLDRMVDYGDHPALINADDGETMTFGQLAQKTVDIALSLTRIGVGKGDVVSICSEKRMEVIPTVLGAFCAGGVFSPIEITYGAAFIGVDNSSHLDSEGFYKTGDVGYYDEDRYFYVVNRIKELIKYKDTSIAPAELESILEREPRVREAGVAARGSLVAALVALQPTARVAPRELQDYLHANITFRMRLEGGVHYVDALPRGAGDKLDRKALQEMLDKILDGQTTTNI